MGILARIAAFFVVPEMVVERRLGVWSCGIPFAEELIAHLWVETDQIKEKKYIHKDGDDLEIIVSDNGAGMTQEMIQSVMAGKARNNGEDRYSTGIAVGNVIDRLELYYKQKDLLTIESEGLGLGTSVHITLPVEVEGTSE